MKELDWLIRSIEAQEARYNPEMRAVTEPFSSPGYHTTLTADNGSIHRTKTASYYALALLDSGIPSYRERAVGVLERLVDAQDTNPDNKTFGIWPWYYEEPLERMSPPDWNWADFIGKVLILALIRHRDRLPAELGNRMEQAVRHACKAIIIRNVGPNYTNIAIMGAFVTLATGEWLGDPELESYGLARLQRFYDYTMDNGAFQEFNSPTYTSIAIEELSSILTETRNDTAKRLTEQLLHVAWGMAAQRFHPRSGQWLGPHDRAYSDLLPNSLLSFLQHGLNGRIAWLSDEAFVYNTTWYGNEIRCPEAFVSCFVEPRKANLSQSLLQYWGEGRREAVTYMSEDYSLATMSRGDLWTQRRNLMAYAATPQGPAYLRLRALHDGYDYTGALLMAAQRENRALFGVHFSTDGGDRHPFLDRIREATISASELRIRFEIGGPVDILDAEWVKDGSQWPVCKARIGMLSVRIVLAAALFAEEEIRYEVNRVDGAVQADIILYAGAPKRMHLPELGQAIVAGQIAIDSQPLEMRSEWEKDTCVIHAYEESGARESLLRIDVPIRPGALYRR